MTYEEDRVVTDEPAASVETTHVDTTPVVEQTAAEPGTVVERRPVTRTVVSDDPIANTMAASQLIQTIVWSVVVLVLLVVALIALHVYAHLF